MSGGPPRWLEATVMRLVPPATREEVAGDLWERYRSPLSYLADAARIMPWLVASQARRSTDPALFMLFGFILFASLGGLEPERTPLAVPIAWRAIPAAVCGLAALVLCNVYRAGDVWTARRAIGDLAWLVVGVAVSQAIGVIKPEWRLPLGWMIGGCLFSALAVLLLRSDAEVANTGFRSSLIGPDEGVALVHRNLRLRFQAQAIALSVLAFAAGWLGLGARPIVAALAGAWSLGTVVLLIRRYLTEQRRATDCLAELERQRDARAIVYWWIAGPLVAGLAYNVVAFGIAMHQPLVTLLGSAASVALIVLVAHMTGSLRRRLAVKLAILRQATPPPGV